LTQLAHNSSHRGAAVVSAMGMACVLALLLAAPLANAQGAMRNDDQREGTTNALPTILNKVGVSQNLNHQLPLDTTFTDETGKTVKLGDYFGSKPAVMAMVYYQCPMLCSEEMDGVTSALEMVRYQPGKDYNVIFISIDPSETPAMAAQKKALYMHRYGRPETAGGWHYLVGTEPNIEAVTNAFGFHYVKVQGPDGKKNQFAHTSAIAIATPQGRLAQYFFGVEYSPKDILFALDQASDGKVGSIAEAIVLYCYHYDPHTGHYTITIVRIIQLACLGTVAFLGIFMFLMFRQEAKGKYALRHNERELVAQGRRNG
jgi:protein SCO1/2